MISTKEQELKALEKIRKIVADLGENSYIGAAFEGCFEMAEDNIQNDFACSMKQRAEKAEKEAEALRKADAMLAEGNEKLTKELEELKAKAITHQEALQLITLTKNETSFWEGRKKASAEKIVELCEDPSSDEFQKAVRVNREATQIISQIKVLEDRLYKV